MKAIVTLLLLYLIRLNSTNAVLPTSNPTDYDFLNSQSSSSAQLQFAPPSSPLPHDKVIRFNFPVAASKDAIEALIAQLEDFNLDIWSANQRVINIRVNEEYEGIITELVMNSIGKEGGEKPVKSIMIESIEELIKTTPFISAMYNTMFSTASLANITSNLAESRSIEASTEAGGSSISTQDLIHDSYHPYASIVAILNLFTSEYPDYTELLKIGVTSEGRDILGLKITNKNYVCPSSSSTVRNEDKMGSKKGKKDKKGGKESKAIPRKKGFLIAGASHGREWIAPSTILYLAHEMLLSAGSNADKGLGSPLLDTFEFTYIPVINVDGYVYSWEEDRFWRKNRQDVGEGCFGMDLNRNWGYHWSGGNRPNPCGETFAGSRPFQAPELQALTSLIQNPSNNIVAFLDVHSFGQMLMFPYSFSCSEIPPTEENLFEAAIGAARALYFAHARSFEVGSVCDIGLATPGAAVDWTYAVGGVSWSWTIELRDRGVYGFLLPPDQIRGSGEEVSRALESLAEFVLTKEDMKRVVDKI